MVRGAKAAYRRGGFKGPLWISEMGYPSDQSFQWDPRYVGINPPTAQFEQARFLHAAVRTLLSSGARRVFVTLRDQDQYWGIFTSEGLLNWPVPTVKPSYYTVRGMALGLIRRAARERVLRGSARERVRLRRARAQRRDSARRASSSASR